MSNSTSKSGSSNEKDLIKKLQQLGTKKPHATTSIDPVKKLYSDVKSATVDFIATVEKYNAQFEGDDNIKKAAALACTVLKSIEKLAPSKAKKSSSKSNKKIKIIRGNKNQIKKIVKRYSGGDKLGIFVTSGDDEERDLTMMENGRVDYCDLPDASESSNASIGDLDEDVSNFDDSTDITSEDDSNEEYDYNYEENVEQEVNENRDAYTTEDSYTAKPSPDQDANIIDKIDQGFGEKNFAAFFDNY